MSPDGKFIAYDALIEQGATDREIRVIASDGSSESTVVRGPGINQSPVWARDGSRLLFRSNRSGTSGLWSVLVRNGKPEAPATLVKADVGDVGLVGFSRTGSLLYTQAVGTRDVFGVDLDSQSGNVRGNPVRLVDTFVGSNLNPAWSPDGKALAYMSIRTGSAASGGYTGSLVIRSLESGQERTIATPFRYGSKPLWFSDGQSILQVARNSQNNVTLYRVDLKTGDASPLINTGSLGPQSAALSPDGRTAYVAPNAELAAFELATGRRTAVSHSGAIKGVAASSDGRSIAFVSHNYSSTPARAHLYVANADGSNVRTLLTTERREELPWSVAWSPESRYIYFVRGRNGWTGNQLWRVGATGGAPAPTGLSVEGLGPIDVSRDGRRVVYGNGVSSRIEVWALENFERMLTTSR